jgi:hypothetical protein
MGFEQEFLKSMWVSVEDKLPLRTKDDAAISVLTINRYGIMKVSAMSRGGEWYDADDVTHWMPLPEPPYKC